MKKAIIYIACLSLGLGVVWVIKTRIGQNRASTALNHGYPISRQVRYGFTLQNNTARVIPVAEFWTYAPVKQTGLQHGTLLKSNYPFELITDNFGNRILYFRFENLAPFTTRLITVRANLMLSAVSSSIKDDPRPCDLNTEPYIESDHPAIVRVAHRLRSADALETVANISDWVSANLSYSGYSGRERGAYYALKYKKGDCTEFADLFVALCRANNIAARRIGGYISPEDAVLKARDYHNWAEFYENGVWKIADPQNKKLKQNQSDYIAMQIIRGSHDNPMGPYHRFRFKGKGLKVRMN
jgi:transglutaminase-like putative cysteine protease